MSSSATLPPKVNAPPAPDISDLYGDTGRLVAAPPAPPATVPEENKNRTVNGQLDQSSPFLQHVNQATEGAVGMAKAVVAPKGKTETERLKNIAKQTLTEPENEQTIKAGQALNRADEEAKAGHPIRAYAERVEAGGHALASGIPLVGPFAAGVAEAAGSEVGAGEYGAAAGDVVGNVLVGKALEGAGEEAETTTVPGRVDLTDLGGKELRGPNTFGRTGGRFSQAVNAAFQSDRSEAAKPSSTEEKLPEGDYVYHATDVSRAESVRQNGLRPKSWYANSPEEAMKSGAVPISGNRADLRVFAVPKAEIEPVAPDAADMGAREVEKGRFTMSGKAHQPIEVTQDGRPLSPLPVDLTDLGSIPLTTSEGKPFTTGEPDAANELPVPANYKKNFENGFTWSNVRAHEAGHAITADSVGFGVDAMYSHLDPNGSAGGLASQQVNYAGGDNPIEGAKEIPGSGGKYSLPLDSVRARLGDMLTTLMGGGVAQEHIGGIPFDSNPGLVGDMQYAKNLMKALDIPDDQQSELLQSARDRAKTVLTHPAADGIIQKYTQTRAEGTPDALHMTADRVNDMVREHREARNGENGVSTQDNTAGHGEAVNRVGKKPVAGREGKGARGSDQSTQGRLFTTHEVNPEDEGDESFNFGANEKSPNSDIPESKRTPTNEAAESAQRYNAAKGQPQINHEAPPLNEGRAQALAAEMDTHTHEPNTPAVKKAYKSLIADVKEQWNHAQKDMGIKFEPSEKDPYTSYDEVKKDVEDNKHMSIYTGGNPLPADHPLSKIDPKTGLTYNTMLRGVHDLYGHIAGNNDFSEQGEAGATNAHRQMMSAASVPALLNETEGQVSQYFHGKEKGGFPPQNATIVPENFVKDWHQEAGERAAKEEAGGIDPRTGTSATEGVGSEILPERRQALDHAPTPADFKAFYEANRDVLDKNPDLKVGWDNNSKVPGGHEINIGIVGDDAARVAKKLDQTSAFNIGKGEVIPTKGSGLRTEFPNYSLEERIKDAKGEPLSNVKDFEHLSKDFYDHLEPDEREYLKGNKLLQRNAMSQYHKIDPSVAETTNAMASGAALGGWWQRYMDVFHGLIPESESPTDAMYHGTPSGDLRGGTMGLHVGTKEAATQALESRIGIRADGKPWDGTQEYGKTLLAGKRTLDQMDPQGLRHTGYNADLPQEDHYPTDKAKYSDGTPVAANAKPNVMPVKITGAMKNSPKTPVTDLSANRLGKRGSAQGVYYKNIGEDAGSISAMVPNGGHIEQIASTIGPSHAEVLKQWHAAVSGNKSVEDANNLAWHSYADWLDAGKPTDRTSINNIVKQNAAQPEGSPKKGNAAISDTLDKKGNVVSAGLDTSKLFALVNSPEMKGERPFSNDAFNEKTPNALVAKTEGARKIPSMGATVAGKGNLNRLVIDAHIRDFYGRTNSGGPAAQYIADSVHLRQAAEALGLKGGEGQEQLWGTMLGLKQLLKTGLTPEEAAGKLNSDVINQIGKDYAEVIANDPEITKPGGLLDRLKEKYGVGSGSAGVGEANSKASASRAGQAESRSSQTPVDQTQLAKTAERIKGQISESKIKKPAIAVPAEEAPVPKKAAPAPIVEDKYTAALKAGDVAAKAKREAAMKRGLSGLAKTPDTK